MFAQMNWYFADISAYHFFILEKFQLYLCICLFKFKENKI